MESGKQLNFRVGFDLQALYDDIRAVETAVRAFRRSLERSGRVCLHRGEFGQICSKCGHVLSETDRQLNEYFEKQRGERRDSQNS